MPDRRARAGGHGSTTTRDERNGENTMKAAVLEGPGAGLVVRDIDIAEPIGREVLVDIKASGLCHSDLHMIENPAGFPAAAVLGHEASGVVVAVGPDVTEFEVGDHVVGCLVSHCGRCERCTTGRPYQCRNAAETMRQPGEGARLSVEGAPAIQFWNLQQVTGMVQPGLQTLDARQLLGQVFRLLLVARQAQGDGFVGQQAWQPVGDLGGALAVAAHVAVLGPGAGQQPARSVQ